MSSLDLSDLNFATLVRSYRDPHPLYDALRAHDSIHYDPSSEFWLVTGHAPTTAILSDPRFSSDVQFENAAPPDVSNAAFLRAAIEGGVIFTDGEAHKRVQTVVLRVLGRMGREAPASITAMVRMLLDRIRENPHFDLVSDFAEPLSLLVVSQLLGLPLEDESKLLQLSAWSDAHGDAVSGYLRVDLQDIARLGAHFRELLAQKRNAGGDDLFSAFIEEGDIFESDEELVINCMMIFGAGRVTTRKVLSNGLPVMLREWPRWRYAQHADAGFSKRATEELLRFVTPTRYLLRVANEDVDLSDVVPGDHLIYDGEKVIVFLEAANRDPDVFAQPNLFNPDRSPNKHLSFGFGSHYCPGAKLARLEIQIALELLFELFPDLSAEISAEPRWYPNPNLGGLSSFRVCPHAAARGGSGS